MADEEIKSNEQINEEEELKFPDDYYTYDKDDMRSLIQGFSQQILQAYRLGDKIEFKDPINKIIVAGMGGSAIAGDLLKVYLHQFAQVPVIVNRGYILPEHADKDTLVIVSSYSGNTEETVSAYKDANRRGCQIVSMVSGGRIYELSITNRTQVIKLPVGIQPRAALAYGFFPMLKIAEKAEILPDQKADVLRLAKNIDKQAYRETGMALSEKLVGKIPLIYSSDLFEPVAYRWKTQINENAKTMAFSNVFSELNHNELGATKNAGKEGRFYCIILRSDMEGHRIVKRMDITKEHFKKADIDVTDLLIKGENFLTKMFLGIHIGDWVSYYLALRYKTDPTPVEEIETFKKELGSYVL